jgi:hypothetical protein
MPPELGDLLHEAAETHHRVYRITDGDDPDWAYLLVLLDKEFSAKQPQQRWEEYYAHRVTEHFAA